MIYLMSSLADSYLGATVNGFSNGSIVVDYTVRFRAEESTTTNTTTNATVSPPIDSSTVVTAFTESLRMAMEMGSVDVSIDETSVMVTGEYRLMRCLQKSTSHLAIIIASESVPMSQFPPCLARISPSTV